MAAKNEKQEILELTAALKALEQQAKKTDKALNEIYRNGSNAVKKQKKTPDELKADKIRTAQMSAMGLALGAVKTIAKTIKKFSDHFNKVSSDFINSTRNINTAGAGYVYTKNAQRAGSEKMNELYEKVIEVNKAENTTVSDFMNSIEKINKEIKLFGSSVDSVDDSLKKYNKTLLDSQKEAYKMQSISKGISTGRSEQYMTDIQAIALDYLVNTVLKNELPEAGKGTASTKNQTYAINSELWEPVVNALANGQDVGPYSMAGWQNWAYEKGYYIPGMDISESAQTDIQHQYLLEQYSTYSQYGLENQQKLVAYNKKQTMVLDHIGGSLASFDEVEQASAFSQANTADELKKEVGESKLTNKTLDEQLEYLVKTYKLDDNQKQMVKDMLEWGITFDNIEKWLTDGKDINNLYTAIDNLRTKGVSANLVNTALTLDVDPNDLILKLEAPDSIELKLPDDVKAAFDKLATLFSDKNVEDYIQSLVDLDIINQATGDKLKDMNKTYHYSSSDISSILTSYYDAFGKMPDYSDEGVSLKDNEPATKFVGTDDGISLLDNDDTGSSGREHTGSGRTFATGGIINHRLSNVTVGEQGKEAVIPLDSQYGQDYLSSVMSEVLSRNESSNIDNSDTFVFNMNGSLYASDKRIPEEFALQMYNAIENIRKKKGVK